MGFTHTLRAILSTSVMAPVIMVVFVLSFIAAVVFGGLGAMSRIPGNL